MVTVLVTGENVEMSDVTKKTVYRNAPLALVAMEMRFPSESSTIDFEPAKQKSFRDHMRAVGDWVIESSSVQQLEVSFGPSPGQTVRTVTVPRLLTRDRAIAVSFPPGIVSVETTKYDGYEKFRPLVQAVFEGVEEVLQPDGIIRLGLRYIDEIRVPAPIGTDLAGWGDWIDSALLSPRLPHDVGSEVEVGAWTAAAQYRFGPNRSLVIRYGPQLGPVVNPTMPLRRPVNPPPGPVFVMDFDSSWQPDDLPAFGTPKLLEICDLLHGPASSSFESFITDRLRDVFRGTE